MLDELTSAQYKQNTYWMSKTHRVLSWITSLDIKREVVVMVKREKQTSDHRRITDR